MSSMPAGWYPDPFSSGGYVRWWDGERWGQSTSVVPGQAPPPAPSAPRQGQVAPSTSDGVHFDDTHLASYGQRVVAYLIDLAIQAVVLIPIVIWLEGPLYQELSATLEANGGQLTQAMFDSLVQKAQQNSLGVTIATLAVTLIYVVPQVALYGRTLGKRVLGLRVQSLGNDGQITWGQSLIRWSIVALGLSLIHI